MKSHFKNSHQSNQYTNSPQMHSNLLFGSIQLLFWLVFHPSAWVNFVARLDENLHPRFSLANLRRIHLQNCLLRRILIVSFIVLPIVSSLLVSLILWITGQNREHIIVGTAVALVGSIVMAVNFSAAVSVAGGIVMSSIGGIIAGISIGIAPHNVHLLNGMPVFRISNFVLVGYAISFSYSVPTGFTMSLLNNIKRNKSSLSGGQKIGGIITGFFVGLASVAAAGLFANGAGLSLQNITLIILALGSVTYGLFIGTSIGIKSESWQKGIFFGSIFGASSGLITGALYATAIYLSEGDLFVASFALAYGALAGTLLSMVCILPNNIVERVAGSEAGSVASTLITGVGVTIFYIIFVGRVVPGDDNRLFLLVFAALACFFALTQVWWRPRLAYPFQVIWNTVLQRADERRNRTSATLFRWHSAFWDEYQVWRLHDLDTYLVQIMEHHPEEGQAAFDYLTHGKQVWAARSVQIELTARMLEQCKDVNSIGNVHQNVSRSQLPVSGSATLMIRLFTRISEDVKAALSQVSLYNQRVMLSYVEQELNSLSQELLLSNDSLAPRFRPIIMSWHRITVAYAKDLMELVEIRQEINNPYIFGVPLKRPQVFVGRTETTARIEELLKDQEHPPLLLYGQRRMGKTSLLYNLRWLLPNRIVPLIVDLQGPVSLADDHGSFLYNLAKGFVLSAQQQDVTLSPLTRQQLAVDPFTIFDDWLDEVEEKLIEAGRSTILLALDEFEALDRALSKGDLEEEAILGTLRHIIQHRPRFKMMFAGSHTLNEFRRWSSYLINAQTVHLTYLAEDEARQLIERPVKDFELSYDPSASQRILALTRGHPYLIQLLCSEIVTIKNEQDPNKRRWATVNEVESSIPKVLIRGSQFFSDIELNQIDASALSLLRFIARYEKEAVVSHKILNDTFSNVQELERVIELLTRRELIEASSGGYRFQVDLIRRWFLQMPEI